MSKFMVERIQAEDEILESSPLYNITDENGRIIAEKCSIELVSNVLREGTPLNKAFFDKIDYLAQCIASLGGTGDDIYKFITTGEYNHMVTIPQQVLEFRVKTLEEKI